MVPLWGTFVFSLQKERGTLSLCRLPVRLCRPQVQRDFLLFECHGRADDHLQPAAGGAHGLLGAPAGAAWRPVVEFITLLPFVIPAIVLVFGLIKTYSRPLTIFGIPILPPLTNSI